MERHKQCPAVCDPRVPSLHGSKLRESLGNCPSLQMGSLWICQKVSSSRLTQVAGEGAGAELERGGAVGGGGDWAGGVGGAWRL